MFLDILNIKVSRERAFTVVRAEQVFWKGLGALLTAPAGPYPPVPAPVLELALAFP